MDPTEAALVVDATKAATPGDGPAIAVGTHAAGLKAVPAEVTHETVHGPVHVADSDAVAPVTAVSAIVTVANTEAIAIGAENMDVTNG